MRVGGVDGCSPPFELPYKVEQDKIDGKTIRYSFNRDDKWTAALKYGRVPLWPAAL